MTAKLLRFHYARNVRPIAQQTMALKRHPLHIFKEICDRVPQPHRSAIDLLMPGKTCTQEKATHAVNAIEQYTLANLNEIFKGNNASVRVLQLPVPCGAHRHTRG